MIATTTTPSSSTIQRRTTASRRGGWPPASAAGGRAAVPPARRRPCPRSITRPPRPGRTRSRPLSRPRGRMGPWSAPSSSTSTARWPTGPTREASDYAAVFAAYGYKLEPAVLDDYFSRYDGVEHAEHSVSEDAYEAWVRARLRDLTGACGVPDPARRGGDRRAAGVGPGADGAPTRKRPPTLSSLRAAGLAVGVCSNWGWELDAFLDEVGLLPLVDAGVTSARAGARKPHPDIYARSVDALGVGTGRGRLRRRLVGARRARDRGGWA